MTPPKVPPIPQDLLSHLEALFPDTMPLPTLTDHEVRYEMGKVAVVRYLRRQFDKQNETIFHARN